MNDDDIEFVVMTAERDLSRSAEPRNSKGETLDEYMANVKAVHASLKDSLFHHMALKRKAKGVHEMQVHDKRVRSLSAKLAACARIARFYGINLK
jgi:hypothetical protein